MKTFENSLGKKYTFSSCDICDAKCCDGRRGSTYAQIILEDFELVSKNFPILFLQGNLGFLKPVVLLTNGKSYCRYIKDNRCTIYEQRPNVCRVYPLSPHLLDIPFIDTLCPAVNEEGRIIIDNGVVQDEFKNEVLESYKDKYIKMHLYFEKLNNKDNLEVLTKISNETFYKFKEDLNDEYLKLHLSSLKNFDNYFTS